MGCGRMSPALLLFLASCSLLQGMLLRPQHVRLEAENFHVRLHWEPDPSSPSHATYEVEWRNRTLNWTKAGACAGNSRSSWVCELYFDRIHDIYWARVRVVAGGQQSEWASSSELQLYRDTIVGPPRLSWLLQDQILSINIITPLTPYKRRTGSYKPVDRVLLKLWYWLQLFEGDLLIQQVPCKQSSEEVPCTLGKLKPSTQYCVRTVAADIARQRSREAEQCLVTPAAPAGFPWIPAVLSASFLLLLLTVVGIFFMQLHVFPNPPETRLPKALALQNSELSVAIRVSPLQLEEDPLALLLQTVLPSHGSSTAGQASAVVPQLLRGLNRDVSGYCDNGFGPGCPEGRDPSCTQRVQQGHALGSQVPSQLEKDGEAGDGDDLPEQLVLVGLTGNSYIGDRDSQIPEIWLPLHFQLYSKCQRPVPGAGSHLPLPVPSGSCSQEYLQESLGTAERWIRLSSVKLPAAAEEDGGQLLCAPQPLLGGGTEPERGDSPVVQGGDSPVVQGGDSPAVQRGDSPLVQGGDSPAVQRGDSPLVQGGDSPAVQGGDSPAVQGGDSPAVQRGDSPAVQRGDSPAVQRGDSPAVQRGDSPAVQRGDSPVVQGGDSPAVQRGDSPVVQGGDSPAVQGGDSPAVQRGDSPAVQGGDSPVVQGGDSPAKQRGDSPLVQGGDSPVVQRGDSPAKQRGDSPLVQGGDSPAVPGGDSPAVQGGDSPVVQGGDSPLVQGGDSPAVQGGDSPVVQRGRSERAAPRVPGPRPPPPWPRSFLRAVAFSGYEPRAPSGSEP